MAPRSPRQNAHAERLIAPFGARVSSTWSSPTSASCVASCARRGVLPEMQDSSLARQRCARLATGGVSNRRRDRDHSAHGRPAPLLRSPALRGSCLTLVSDFEDRTPPNVGQRRRVNSRPVQSNRGFRSSRSSRFRRRRTIRRVRATPARADDIFCGDRQSKMKTGEHQPKPEVARTAPREPRDADRGAEGRLVHVI